MIRTSLLLPELLHQRLSIIARRKGTSLTKIVRQLLDAALAKAERTEMQHTYKVLRELDGVSQKQITNASEKINETLYGEQGAWRGSRE